MAGMSDDHGSGAAFSKRLVLSLLAMLGLFLAAFVGTLLWLAREHDALAASGARLLIEHGIEDHVEHLARLAADRSSRDEVVAWRVETMAASAADEDFDLLVVLHPDGTERGWIAGSGEVPRGRVLPVALRDRLAAAKRAEHRAGAVVSDLAVVDGELWHLAAAHVGPQASERSPEATRDASVAIYGQRFAPEAAAALGGEFFIDGVTLAERLPADPRLDALALLNAAGQAQAFVVWPRPAPGTAILRRLAPPIALVLLSLVAVALAIGRHVMRSARRLEGALDDARAGDRAKSEFLTTISHELRTPMNGVIGVAQLLEDTPLDEEQAELVAILNASATSQMELIEELLCFGEIEAGALRLHEEAVDLGPLLAEAAGIARVAAARKGLELRVSVPRDAPGVLADAKRLRQVVVNLLGNAVKFTDEGRVEMAVAFEARGEGGTLMRLAVSDTGPGIPADQHARVFERFSQGDGSTRRRKGGTGLGLSISRAIARQMGGEIALRSAPGEGSTFTLLVPLRVVGPAAGAAPGVALEAAA